MRATVRLGLAVDEVRRRTAELGQFVHQLLEMRHRPGRHLQRVAVVTGCPQALEDLGPLLQQFVQRTVLVPGYFSRTTAITANPTFARSTSARYPLITPVDSSRFNRSVAAEALRFTRRPSSVSGIRPSRCSSTRMAQSVGSRSRSSGQDTGESTADTGFSRRNPFRTPFRIDSLNGWKSL